MNGIRFALLTVLFLFLSSAFVYFIAADETDRVRFRWAFVALNDHEGNGELVQLTHDATLQSGDQLKMYLELGTKCFVYVLHHGSRDRLPRFHGLQEAATGAISGTKPDAPAGVGKGFKYGTNVKSWSLLDGKHECQHLTARLASRGDQSMLDEWVCALFWVLAGFFVLGIPPGNRKPIEA